MHKVTTAVLFDVSFRWTSAGGSDIAKFLRYTTILLSFASPNMTYTGGLTFEGTGLMFTADPITVKNSISTAQENGVKVLLSVGGEATDWDGLNTAGIAAFVRDFGLDGVDIDYEPTVEPACVFNANQKVTCATDAEYINLTRALREAIPPPLILSSTVGAGGAYGEGMYADMKATDDDSAGSALRMLSAVGGMLDRLHIMAYDTENLKDQKTPFDAYKTVYNGPIVVGVVTPGKSDKLKINGVRALGEYSKKNGGDGMFVWSIQNPSKGFTADEFVSVCGEVFGL